MADGVGSVTLTYPPGPIKAPVDGEKTMKFGSRRDSLFLPFWVQEDEVDKAVNFYVSLLDFVVLREQKHFGRTVTVAPHYNHGIQLMFGYSKGGGVENQNIYMKFHWREDVMELHYRLTDAGVSYQWIQETFEFDDPTGNHLGFCSWA